MQASESKMSSPEPSPSTAQSTLVNSTHSTARTTPSLDNNSAQLHLLPRLYTNATPQIMPKNSIATRSNHTDSGSSDLALSLAATLAVTERQKDERIASATVAASGPCLMAVQQSRKEQKPGSMTAVYEEVPLESKNDGSREKDEWKQRDRLQSTLLRIAALLNEQIEACENLERSLKDSEAIKTGTSTIEGTKLNPGYGDERDREVKVNGSLILNHERSVGNGGGETSKSAIDEQLTALREKAEATLGLVAESLTAPHGS